MRENSDVRGCQVSVRRAYARVYGPVVRKGSAAVIAMLAATCAGSFEPIAPDGPAFSIFGYLDAAADTQWIRVSPLRTTLRASGDPAGVVVTLEGLGSGRIIELRDTAMRFATVQGFDTVYAHNFWTTQRIEAGASYRFRAQGSDGAVAESIVPIPRDHNLEVWVHQQSRLSYIRVEGLKQVAFMFWNTSYYDRCYTSRFFRKIQRFAPGGDSVARMIGRLEYGRELPVCDGRGFTMTRPDVDVVGSDAPWPSDEDYLTWRLAPHFAASNVTGALGFIGGVLTKQTRVEQCELPGPNPPDTYCKLRYDSATATLHGTLAGSCTVPPDSVHIELRELAAPPGERPRTRYGILDPAGAYDIGALRPGLPHRLTILGIRPGASIPGLHSG